MLLASKVDAEGWVLSSQSTIRSDQRVWGHLSASEGPYTVNEPAVLRGTDKAPLFRNPLAAPRALDYFRHQVQIIPVQGQHVEVLDAGNFLRGSVHVELLPLQQLPHQIKRGD